MEGNPSQERTREHGGIDRADDAGLINQAS